MATVIPYIPRFITVHLGPPKESAENITVSFPDYVKNVASSEIYPTWEPAALRANILAIISFALNRVYTEFYPSRGYNFQITASTAYDQKFIRGRDIFQNIDRLVDEIFDTYIRRKGFIEPLAAKFCNGTTVTCDGLSQWGSQYLAKEGKNSLEILYRYYGTNIELVDNAPIKDITASYPGTPLRRGSVGPEVSRIQSMLNTISRNYPAIPRISPKTGVFGPSTEEAVKVFQKIFDLVPDGIVGKATWYKMVSLYVGVQQLSELVSKGQSFTRIEFEYPGVLREGARGESVQILQYMLAMLAEFNNSLLPIEVDGVYGPQTTQAVKQYQGQIGLAPDGVVGRSTWDSLQRQFSLAGETTINDFVQSGRGELTDLVSHTQYPGQPMSVGQQDPDRKEQS